MLALGLNPALEKKKVKCQNMRKGDCGYNDGFINLSQNSVNISNNFTFV